jgi:hypothetical protein
MAPNGLPIHVFSTLTTFPALQDRSIDTSYHPLLFIFEDISTRKHLHPQHALGSLKELLLYLTPQFATKFNAALPVQSLKLKLSAVD